MENQTFPFTYDHALAVFKYKYSILKFSFKNYLSNLILAKICGMTIIQQLQAQELELPVLLLLGLFAPPTDIQLMKIMDFKFH